jgi:hypothetical protein
VGVIPFEELEPRAARGEAVMPVSEAAVEAARTPGTEIDGTEVGGVQGGARGRWVQLRRRRRKAEATVEPPERTDDTPTAGRPA